MITYGGWRSISVDIHMRYIMIIIGAAYLFVSVLGLGSVNGSIEWKTTFGGSEKVPSSNNVLFDCNDRGYPICCSLLNETLKLTGEGDKSYGKSQQSMKEMCQIHKEYIPSPYELAHLEMAIKLGEIVDLKNRSIELVNFIRSDVTDSIAWLKRVDIHMKSEVLPEITSDDQKYLSRFVYTKNCTGVFAHLSSSWTEYIEPLTVHARHPFSFRLCKVNNEKIYSAENIKLVGSLVPMQNLDYLIIKSGRELHDATSLSDHTHARFAAHRNHHSKHRADHVQSRNYFLDAGTSTFQSSLLWFLCAFMQRKVAFDQVYGFEYALLEPEDFWKRVPNIIKPIYHFFNAPISGEPLSDLSPLRFIKEIATVDDFVAFKLDVDTLQVEMPQALALLRNPEFSQLVDEFFFELHFHCEIMKDCGWGSAMPVQFDGMKLDRAHVLKFFAQLRHSGIRAHVWP